MVLRQQHTDRSLQGQVQDSYIIVETSVEIWSIWPRLVWISFEPLRFPPCNSNSFCGSFGPIHGFAADLVQEIQSIATQQMPFDNIVVLNVERNNDLVHLRQLYGHDENDDWIHLAKTAVVAGNANLLLDYYHQASKSRLLLETRLDADDAALSDVQLRSSRMRDNMESILLDAFAGQCSPDHSCNQSAKRALGKLLTKVQQDKA